MADLVDETGSDPLPAHKDDIVEIEPAPVETDHGAGSAARSGSVEDGVEATPDGESGVEAEASAGEVEDATADGEAIGAAKVEGSAEPEAAPVDGEAGGAGEAEGGASETEDATADGEAMGAAEVEASAGEPEEPPADEDAGGAGEVEGGAGEPETAPADGEAGAAAPAAVAGAVGIAHDTAQEEAEERKRRRRLLVSLAVLLVALGGTITMIYRYVTRPAPLPDLLPVRVEVNYAPHYLFSIYGVDEPVGIALSPEGDRIYVAETGGERQVKILDRDGNHLGSLAPPRTGQAERSPVYLATDPAGRVYVADRLQHALFVYDGDGRYLDTILGPDLTLSEYVAAHIEGVGAGATFAYDAFEPAVYYRREGQAEQDLPAPDPAGWSPLGVRIDDGGRMLVTDVGTDRHCVHVIPSDAVLAAVWEPFDPPGSVFGAVGQGNGHFFFPNVAVTDSQGRIYVTDGNNGRISVWNDRAEFLYDFGQGAGESALNLPRGADIDARDRLHVVDAVGQTVRVYDVSGPEPRFLFAFGNWGLGDGQFNYPNDIALDSAGRLYIADRENNRIQVWSY